MDLAHPELQFYLPEIGGDPLPQDMDEYWPWITRYHRLGTGRHNWTLQSYIHLRDAGLPVRLVRAMPRAGIVISHRDFLPLTLRPRRDVFLVCIKPDRKQHTWAHFYLVQNESDPLFRTRDADRAAWLPYWPQPSLVPRRKSRGTLLEHAAYFGRSINLAPQLQSPEFHARMRELGVRWSSSLPPQRWNDYADVDVTISVRSFETDNTLGPILHPDSKPPSKLVNSWHTGVPAIVGPESAFKNLRRSELDFIEVASVDDLFIALSRLRSDPQLYRDMVVNGLERAKRFSAASVAGLWRAVVETQILPRYERWMQRTGAVRLISNTGRAARYLANPLNLARIRWS